MHQLTIAILGNLPVLAVAFLGPSSKSFAHTLTCQHHHHHYRVSTWPAASPIISTSLHMGLLDMFKSDESSTRSKRSSDYRLEIDDLVGSGSYGTVHQCSLLSKNDNTGESESSGAGVKIAKRAWTGDELMTMAEAAAKSKSASIDADLTSTGPHKVALKSKVSEMTDENNIKDRAERCRYYLDVERHCLEKLSSGTSEEQEGETKVAKYVPTLLGIYPDEDKKDWLVFDLVVGQDSTKPAPTLANVLQEDWIDQHQQDEADPNAHHHLYVLQKALGMSDDSSFGDVLDQTFLALLRTVSAVNECNIVHRDVKPGNLLVTGKDGGAFVLIDFGSAADMDPPSGSASTAFSSALGGSGGRVGLDDEGRVALSPIYAAPELFVRRDRAPLQFDSFSTALVFTQLLFNLLDERADASYRQQLEDCDFSLDSWLQRELSAELQPDGIEAAILYLSERPGLWAVLRDMLHPNPERRVSTANALMRAENILRGSRSSVSIEEADGNFFAEIVATFELCELPDSGSVVGVVEESMKEESSMSTGAQQSLPPTERSLVIPRPLHYVATFKRSESLGLLLSEVDPDGDYDDELSADDTKKWEAATATASPGEVYVRGTVEGGQAEDIGIFDVGDKLMGVGEFPFIAEGFNTVVDMLQAQPQAAKTVTLHFSRASKGRSHSYKRAEAHRAKVASQGAWSARGRRKTQEDRFILHEVQDGNNAALLTGVFDGHGGDAASTSLAQLMPSLFSVELAGILSTNSAGADYKASSIDLRDAMESAYEITCRTYRQGCDDEGLCIADYDPREGIVVAGTAATDLIAGSTITMSCLSVAEDGADVLSVLNCGDSRTLAFGRPRGGSPKDSVVYFSTRDHSPNCEREMERLALGKNRGYSQPKCSMSRWRIKVGDYQYALARSLEGSFATSKGIVSDPDISTIDLVDMLAERELCSIVLASDGLFEVIDNEQAGRDVTAWREAGQSADEVAKQLCRKAVELGSPDNVSVVVLYLD